MALKGDILSKIGKSVNDLSPLRGAAVGASAIAYMGYQANSGLDPEGLSRDFYGLTLGDPNIVIDATGRDVSVGGLQFMSSFGLSSNPNVPTGAIAAAFGGGITALTGAGVYKSAKGWKGKVLGAGILASSIVTGGASYGVGKYGPSLASGFVNPTTIGDYNRSNRTRLPTVNGDIVLGMYNSRLA